MIIPGLDYSLVDGKWIHTSKLEAVDAFLRLVEPEPLTVEVTPEPEPGNKSHWTEKYWVKHKDFWYFRYMWMEGESIRRCHIPGGNINSGVAKNRAALVNSMIKDGSSPQQIQQQIRAWRKRKQSRQ